MGLFGIFLPAPPFGPFLGTLQIWPITQKLGIGNIIFNVIGGNITHKHHTTHPFCILLVK